MKEYYILLDNKNTPIKDYTDEMLFEISLYPTTLDEAEVYATTENGLKEIIDRKYMFEEYGKIDYHSKEKLEFPLKVVKIKSERKIIEEVMEK